MSGARKVWVLPLEMSDRIQTYQAAHGIASEVEAARRLIDIALQHSDTPEDILRRLQERFDQRPCIRSAAADVLACHVQIVRIEFDDERMRFSLRDGSHHEFPIRPEATNNAQ